eukprot:8731877-Pyramimonas_sp.AAC.1
MARSRGQTNAWGTGAWPRDILPLWEMGPWSPAGPSSGVRFRVAARHVHASRWGPPGSIAGHLAKSGGEPGGE